MTTPRRPDPGKRLALLVLIGPFTLLLLGVFVVPVVVTIYLSFFSTVYEGTGFGTARTAFVGLRNFVMAVGDPEFLSGLGVIGIYAAIFIPLALGLGLALALLLDSGLAWARQISQTVLFLPHAVPGIIAALIWLYLYTPGLSPVLRALGGADIELRVLGDPLLLPGIVNISLWSAVGYNMVIFYAALKAVPDELLEAAAIDGAGRIRTALTVKVPLIRGAVVTIGMFAVIGALQLFTEPMLLSQASPAVGTRFTPNMYVFDAAFTRNNYGLAAASALVLLVVCCLLSYAVVRLTNRGARR
ncbi:carbohydrate ABC transporter permease [Georgenia deserti]|uniref:Carbohydrate ABC transporter permease n=1 Tax=Georgenia deserti TaxID=2093781 RepID=A0ABW4L121_9MICO